MPDLGVLLPVVLAVAMVGVCVLLTISIVLARRLSAQLDNKVARMEALLRQADERIEAFGRAAGLSHTGTTVPAGSGQSRGTQDSKHLSRRQTRAEEPLGPDPVTRAVYEQADAGRTPLEIAQELDEQVGKVELILALREHGT